MKGLLLYAALVFLCCLKYTTSTFSVDNAEWEAYKANYGKSYTNVGTTEANARYYYAYNKNLINNHNYYYERGLRTYRLGINQFTDMRLITFNALFPVTTNLTQVFHVSLPQVGDPISNSFNPIDDVGLQTTIEDQGTVCNSGWAYATAKAVELFQTMRSTNLVSESLSAQNLIDCAGRSRGCSNQVPQTGFDYLTQYDQELHLSSEYLNVNKESQPGFCILPTAPTRTVALQNYSLIYDKDDATMRRMVNAQYPVVIEFNPTSFEFMHYEEGVFQQPSTSKGSHFMTVIGFGVTTNLNPNLNYFILQNSFNRTWGENGLIKIAYSTAKPLAKSAILPVL